MGNLCSRDLDVREGAAPGRYTTQHADIVVDHSQSKQPSNDAQAERVAFRRSAQDGNGKGCSASAVNTLVSDTSSPGKPTVDIFPGLDTRSVGAQFSLVDAVVTVIAPCLIYMVRGFTPVH